MATWDGELIVAALEALGIEAVVEQTGGGVATLYIGNATEQLESGGGRTDLLVNRFEAIAGPGWFDGPWWTEPKFDSTEFGYGLDDDGVTNVVNVEDDIDETALAVRIAAFVEGNR